MDVDELVRAWEEERELRDIPLTPERMAWIAACRVAREMDESGRAEGEDSENLPLR